MTTINDFVKPKDKFKPLYDSKGIRIETEEEIKNWESI
jgi:hypothetical protein